MSSGRDARPSRSGARTVATWSEFREAWSGVTNFLMTDACVPFAFDLPPVEQVIDEVRRDPDARIWRGAKAEQLDTTDIAESFRTLPIDEAVNTRFQMSHFALQNFYGPGRLFHGFEEGVMEPWRRALTAAGFTWTRCYPILFISGPGAATNYHLDFSHVLVWQRHGVKRFSGLRDPDAWVPLEGRIHSKGASRPEGIGPDDILSYDLAAGDVLWNAFLTPHWVEAADGVAYSLNISHGGLRLNGALCRHEQELEDWRKAHPEDRETGVVKG